MPESFVPRIAELERILKQKGLKPQLELAHIALDEAALLSYAVVQQSGEPPANSRLYINQILKGSITLSDPDRAELERLVRSHSGIYPIEQLAQNPVIKATAAGQALTPTLFVDYESLKFPQRFLVTVSPDGSFTTDAHVIRNRGKYHTAAFGFLAELAFHSAGKEHLPVNWQQTGSK